jgi:hypothetical protein
MLGGWLMIAISFALLVAVIAMAARGRRRATADNKQRLQ